MCSNLFADELEYYGTQTQTETESESETEQTEMHIGLVELIVIPSYELS